MYKIVTLFFSALFLISCKPPITLIKAVKQTIIPGRSNLPNYNNYVIHFTLNKDTPIFIDSIQVFEQKKSFLTNFTIRKKGDAHYSIYLKEKGNYTLEIPVRDRKIIKSNLETTTQNKLIIFYSKDRAIQKLEISKFETETLTQR